MFVFSGLGIVLCVGECRNDFVALADGVPAAVVEVEMGIDDDVDLFGINFRSGEILEQLGLVAVNFLLLFIELIADAGFDEDIFFRRCG